MSDKTITENKIWFDKRVTQTREMQNKIRHMLNMWGNNGTFSITDMQALSDDIVTLGAQLICASQGHPDAINVGDDDHNVMRCPVCDDGDEKVENNTMKLIVKAKCQEGGKIFDGLDDQACFSEYVDDNFPKCVSGGYMSFKYNESDDTLYVITEYETTRKLTKEEEKIVIDYTQGQWSDGIGEGFEQQIFDDSGDEPVYNPSPWYHGQVPWIEYKD